MKKTLIIFLVLLSGLSTLKCGGEDSAPTAPAYALRDTGPGGGLIFYDKGYYSDGWRYLEAAPADESGVYRWKTSDTSTPGTSTAIGTGYANTYTCMTGTNHPAAEVVRNSTHGGYSGWFLPSKDELNLMYVNLKVPGVGGFALEDYWSSSECGSGSAWSQYFDGGVRRNTS